MMKKLFPGRNPFYSSQSISLIISFLMVLFALFPAHSQNNSSLNVATWVYLEGSMMNGQIAGTYTLPMNSELNNSNMLPGQCFTYENGLHYIPGGQPYNKAPWFYYGNEGDAYDSNGDPEQGSAGYPENCVDWILVSLRHEPDGDNLCRKAALLFNDGHIEFDSPFISEELGKYSSFYIVIEHRNHLVVMSGSAVTPVNDTLTYDFRNTQSYIDDPFNYGAVGQKEIPGMSGVFAMVSGNSDQVKTGNELPGDRTQINNNDWSRWSDLNGTTGNYCCSDFNLNCDCNYDDMSSVEQNNGLFTSVPLE